MDSSDGVPDQVLLWSHPRKCTYLHQPNIFKKMKNEIEKEGILFASGVVCSYQWHNNTWGDTNRSFLFEEKNKIGQTHFARAAGCGTTAGEILVPGITVFLTLVGSCGTDKYKMKWKRKLFHVLFQGLGSLKIQLVARNVINAVALLVLQIWEEFMQFAWDSFSWCNFWYQRKPMIKTESESIQK